MLPTVSIRVCFLNQPPMVLSGLFLEGASLDRKTGKLVESRPKVLYEQMPVIYIYAINTTAGKDSKLYECPIYRKPARTDLNYIGSIDFESDIGPRHWTMRGVALLCDIKQRRPSLAFDIIDSTLAWSSLQEGDERPDRPNSQTCMELSHALFFGVGHKHNSLPPGPIQPSSTSTKELHDTTIGLNVNPFFGCLHTYLTKIKSKMLMRNQGTQ